MSSGRVTASLAQKRQAACVLANAAVGRGKAAGPAAKGGALRRCSFTSCTERRCSRGSSAGTGKSFVYYRQLLPSCTGVDTYGLTPLAIDGRPVGAEEQGSA